MRPKIIMHVNYCEQGQTIPEICAKAVRWGFDGVEFRRRDRQRGGSVEQYLDTIACAAGKSGLKQVLFSAGPDCVNPSEKARMDDLEAVMVFYRLARERFALSICNTFSGVLKNPSVPEAEYARHGSAIATEDHWQWHIKAYRQLGDLVQSLGFRLAFETHPCYLHDWPDVTRKLVDRINHPAVGVNLDYVNYYAMKENISIAEALDTVGDRLYYVHLKNEVRMPGPHLLRVGLADGDVNCREFMRLLKQRGYAGMLAIEAPRRGDREWFARQDIAYLKALLDELEWG